MIIRQKFHFVNLASTRWFLLWPDFQQAIALQPWGEVPGPRRDGILISSESRRLIRPLNPGASSLEWFSNRKERGILETRAGVSKGGLADS